MGKTITGKYPYLFWRGNHLWSRKPWDDKPKGYRYSMGITCDGTAADRARCELEAIERRYVPVVKRGSLGSLTQETEAEHYRPKFGELMDSYIASFGGRPDTQRRVRMQCGTLIREFGDKYWDEVTYDVFNNWLMSLRAERGLAVATVKIYRTHAKAATRYASLDERGAKQIPKDLLKNIPSLNEASAVREVYFSPDELARYLDWYEVHDPLFYPFFYAMVVTARRPTHLSRWQWEWIKEDHLSDGSVLHYITPVVKHNNKNDNPFYLTGELWDIIFSQGWRTGYVFRNILAHKADQQWSSNCWQRRINKLKEAFPNDAKLQKMEIKDCRGSFATNADKNGMPIQELQCMLSHRDIKSTRRYIKSKSLDYQLRALRPDLFEKDKKAQSSKMG